MAKKYQVIGTPFDGSDLPEVSTNDNGKVLRVVNGEWVADDQPAVDGSDLPEVSEDDNGKVLRVVDGEWVADDQPVADGVTEASDEDIENLFKEESASE